MDALRELLDAGFSRVLVLPAERYTEGIIGRLLLCLWNYTAAVGPLHPYYPESQKAYQAAKAFCERHPAFSQRNDILLKPILRQIPIFRVGRNTLSYLPDIGSRFHIQTLVTEELLPCTPLPEGSAAVCEDCGRCRAACPGGAIQPDGFHRDRCIRNWMMSGKPIPEPMREAMGERLLGCDLCEACCPMNQPVAASCTMPVSAADILADPKGASEVLSPLIGRNMAISNRLLAQTCLMAGHMGDPSLLPLLQSLNDHPSEAVREHAGWAAERLKGALGEP